MLYYFFVLTAFLSIAAYFVKSRNINHGITLAYVGLMGLLGYYLSQHVGEPLNNFFYCDTLGLIFYFILLHGQPGLVHSLRKICELS